MQQSRLLLGKFFTSPFPKQVEKEETPLLSHGKCLLSMWSSRAQEWLELPLAIGQAL